MNNFMTLLPFLLLMNGNNSVNTETLLKLFEKNNISNNSINPLMLMLINGLMNKKQNVDNDVDDKNSGIDLTSIFGGDVGNMLKILTQMKKSI